MKAWLLEQFNGLDGLRLAHDAPMPQPGPGEVRLRVNFAALNPADRYLAERLYPARPPLPHVLGRDAAGVVDAVGDGVDQWKPGDRAALLRGEAGVTRWGTFAEFVVVPAGVLIDIPQGWAPEQAAAAPLVYLTAWQALTNWGAPEPGAAALVTGASGGVGLAALQLGQALGLRMIGLTRDMDKAKALMGNGAGMVITPDDPQFKDKIRDFAGERGVALAVDNIGGAGLIRVIDVMGLHGRIGCVGRLAGPVPEFNTAALFFRRIMLGGIAVGSYTAAEAQAAWHEILVLMEKSGQRPVLDRVIEFEALKDGFERMKKGPLGKVVLKVSEGKN